MGRGNGRTQSTRAAATRRGGPNTNPPPRWHGFSGHVSVRPGGAIARFLEKGPERQDNKSSADTPSRHQEQKMSSDASPTPSLLRPERQPRCSPGWSHRQDAGRRRAGYRRQQRVEAAG
jgi:hypothetical protein